MKLSDERYTRRYAVEPLIEYINPEHIIWCPFDTEESQFVKVFRENGFKVVHSHIDEGKDFYIYEPEKWDIIISNPPFTGKRRIFEHAFSFNKPFCLLMTLDWIRDATPKKLFRVRNKDLQLLMFDERMQFDNCENGKIPFSSAYYCYDFLPKNTILKSLKENRNQLKLGV